jgi:hypothetical protein
VVEVVGATSNRSSRVRLEAGDDAATGRARDGAGATTDAATGVDVASGSLAGLPSSGAAGWGGDEGGAIGAVGWLSTLDESTDSPSTVRGCAAAAIW